MEASKRNLEAKLERLQASHKKDDVNTFEELGVDRLFVDEAHNYKNLYLHTKMQNVAGISQKVRFYFFLCLRDSGGGNFFCMISENLYLSVSAIIKSLT